MTLRGPSQSDPIDMDGFKTLHVEAWLRWNPGAAPGSATVRVLGTEDKGTEKKTWGERGAAITLLAGGYAEASFEAPGRLVRVEAQAPPGVGNTDITIRIRRS